MCLQSRREVYRLVLCMPSVIQVACAKEFGAVEILAFGRVLTLQPM